MPSGIGVLGVFGRPSPVDTPVAKVEMASVNANLRRAENRPAGSRPKSNAANIRQLGPSQSPHAFFKKCQPQQNQRATKKLAQEIYKLCMRNEALARLQPSMAQCYEVAKKNPSKSAYFLANGLQTQSRREKQSLTNQLPSTPPPKLQP